MRESAFEYIKHRWEGAEPHHAPLGPTQSDNPRTSFVVRTNGTLTEQYTYDNNGNRLTGLDAGAASTATYDSQDRLRTYGDWVYTCTDNGELSSKTHGTSGDTWTYDYDVMGNLQSVTLPDDRVVSYNHDGRNRRIAKLIDGVLVRR